MIVLQPLSAQAEAVLDESGSFQIAAARKLGADKLVIGKKNGKAFATKSDACFSEYGEVRSVKGTCIKCPANATCSKGEFTCNDGYFKKDDECWDICKGTTCKDGYKKYATETNKCFCYAE